MAELLRNALPETDTPITLRTSHLSELAGSVDNEVTLASVASEDGAVAVDEQPDDEGHRQRELEKVLEGVRREEDAGVGNKSSMKCLTS